MKTGELDSLRDVFVNFRGKGFRPYQKEAIEFALQDSDYRVKMIQAPTGSGKSLIGACVAAEGRDSTYLVGTKTLQDQVMADFPEFAVLKGRGNYPCVEFPGTQCDTCRYLNPKVECDSFDECEYQTQKRIVAGSAFRVLNYSYFLHETVFAGDNSLFRNPGVMICDEADTLEDHLLSFIQLQVSNYQMKSFHVDIPEQGWGIGEYRKWINRSYETLAAWYRDVKHLPPERVRPLTQIAGKFGIARKMVDDTWLVNIAEDGDGKRVWSFKPVWLTDVLTDRYFLGNAGGRVVLLSATFPTVPVYSQCTGIPEYEIGYHNVPSVFPAASRPIHFDAVANMGFKTWEAEFPFLEMKIRAILANHRLEKGLIHTNSYKLAQRIAGIMPQRMVTHNTGDRQAVLDAFKRDVRPMVMVSPSMDRGVSFDGDLARFVIVAKTPFASLGDPQVERRLKSPGGRRWYDAVTAQTMEQQAGRGMRSAEDRCEVHFLDTHSLRLYEQDPGMFSQYFRDCVVEG
uniref:DNA 5'-3' helicase n=1 Tax=viral metagenome TaxID=1070528 RepID=A0A6M3IJ50_9ZZZZ